MTAIHALILLLAIGFGVFGWEIGFGFAGTWGGIVGILVGLIVGFSAIVAFLKTFAGLYPYFPRCQDCERSDSYRCISSDDASSRWKCECGAEYDKSKIEFARIVNGQRTSYMIKRSGKWCHSTSKH